VLLAIVLAAAAPAVRHRPADVQAARASVLAAADLGKGWTGEATAQRGVALSCPGYRPSGAGVVETGAAASPALRYGRTGPFVSQQASVYASARQADAYWRRAVRPGLLACVVQNVEALRARGVKVTVLSKRRLPLAAAVGHAAAYRVKARANALVLYFDVLVLGSGRTITTVSVSSFQQAPPAAFEQAVARILVRKLGGPAA